MRPPLYCLFAGAIAMAATPSAAADEVVDVELVLAVDVSLSMQASELEIQRRGYSAGIADPSVWSAIRGGLHQKIAITYVEWAGRGQYRVVVPWTVIDGPEDALEVARIIGETPTGGLRRTSISSAIDISAGLFEENGIRGLKRVIDVSGDGPNNQGRPVADARDEAVAKGIIINGLPLMTRDGSPFSYFDIPDLDRFYSDCVIGGPGSFVLPVNEWSQFPEAVRRKLVLELASRPATGYLPVVKVADGETYDCLIGERMWQQRRFFLDMQ